MPNPSPSKRQVWGRYLTGLTFGVSLGFAFWGAYVKGGLPGVGGVLAALLLIGWFSLLFWLLNE